MLSLTTVALILAFLILANGLFTMAETALVSAHKTRLRQLAAKSRAAARALQLAEEPARYLAFVQFWLTLTSVAGGVLGATQLAARVSAAFSHSAVLSRCSGPLALGAVVLGLSLVMLLLGELLPKRIGLAHPERVAVLLAGAMHLATTVAAVLLRGFEIGTEFFAVLLRIRPRPAAESVTEDEVRALVEQGLHAGVFQRAEKEMIERVLALDRLRVTAIMTPRPKIVFLNLDDPEEANWRKIVTSGHSYFPVYQGNRDQVIGMVAVKALWAHSAIGLPTTLKNLLVPPLVAPETMTAVQVLEQFKKAGRHTAIVTDEFGAVQGMVTLIDVLEAIVGDLPERGSRSQPHARRREDGAWVVDAMLSTAELKSLLSLDSALPQEREAEFQTLGGFVLTQFGRIPSAGDSFEWAGWRFEVAEMDRRRVDKLVVSRAPAAASSSARRAP